jgi:hypothetical protein
MSCCGKTKEEYGGHGGGGHGGHGGRHGGYGHGGRGIGPYGGWGYGAYGWPYNYAYPYAYPYSYDTATPDVYIVNPTTAPTTTQPPVSLSAVAPDIQTASAPQHKTRDILIITSAVLAVLIALIILIRLIK